MIEQKVYADQVRDLATRLLGIHELRAADSLQLAAALTWCQQRPANRNFVCGDERLSRAAASTVSRFLSFHELFPSCVLPGHDSPTKARKASTTVRDHRLFVSGALAAPPRPRFRSCPAPSMGNNDVAVGIRVKADFISSSVPNGSREPCTNTAGVRSLGK
jgi:hypothetical protein